jgi:hypothetical protein
MHMRHYRPYFVWTRFTQNGKKEAGNSKTARISTVIIIILYNICILQQGAHVLSSQKYHQPCSDVGFSTILLFNMVTNMTDNLTETNDILTDLYDEPIYVTLPRSMLRGNHRSS